MKSSPVRKFILLLCLILSSPSFALTGDQVAALKVIKDYKVFLNQGNARLLNWLTVCVSATGDSKPLPNYLLRTKSATGEDLSEEYTCRELLEQYFGYKEKEPFSHRKAFRSMQLYAILAQSGSLNVNDAEETESLDGDPNKQLSAYEHPVRGTLDRVWGQISRMPRPDEIVWKKAREVYTESIEDNCREFLIQKKAMIEFQLQKQKNKPFMNNLCQVLTKKSNGLSFLENLALGAVSNSFKEFSIKKRKIWRMKYQQLYFEQIGQAPQYLLSDSLYLSRAQIQSVIQRMIRFQREAFAEFNSMKGDGLLKVAPLIDLSPMTIAGLVSRKMRWSDAHTQEVLESLTKLHQSREFRNGLLQGAAMLAATTGCYLLPSGRMRLFLRTACLFSLGLPLDLYFIYDASLVRLRTVQEFAMTPELEYIIGNSEKISEANRDLIFNLVFLPLDIPMGKILSTLKKAK